MYVICAIPISQSCSSIVNLKRSGDDEDGDWEKQVTGSECCVRTEGIHIQFTPGVTIDLYSYMSNQPFYRLFL